MSDSDEGQRMQLIKVEELEQQLAAKKTEVEKLQIRLKGYETVAKLATDKDNKNKELNNRIKELEEKLENHNRVPTVERQTSTEAMSASLRQSLKTSNEFIDDMSSREGLNDLKSLAALTNSHHTGNSSFSIIGKSSGDLFSNQADAHGTVNPAYHSFTDAIGRSESESKIESEETKVNQTNNVASQSAIDKEEDQRESKSLEDYIQVFPEGSQSGGSDFYEVSFEKELNGGQSLMNTSRNGPMSLIATNNGSIASYQYVEIKKEEKAEKKAVQNADPKMVTFDALPLTNVSGAGARPKQISYQSKPTPTGVCEETNGEEGEQRDTDETFESKQQKLVRIPNEDRDYRINNAPMLSFGRGTSQTEISALTSFGSDLSSLDIEKSIQVPEEYNDLNMGSGSHASISHEQVFTREETIPKTVMPGRDVPAKEKSSLATQALKIKNILSSKSNISETRNIILPFLGEVEELERVSKQHEAENKQFKLLMTKIPPSNEESEREPLGVGMNQDRRGILLLQQTHDGIHKAPKELMNSGLEENNKTLKVEIDRLRIKTNQLHIVNKDWKDKWDILRKQMENENSQLRENIQLLMQERERQRREADTVISAQKEELHQVNNTQRELEKEMAILRSGKSQEKQLLEQLKQDYGTLHQEKRALEIQLETMKANNVESSRPIECIQKKSELEMELSIVKRQVTLFMDDFNKEHHERLSIENKLQKAKETNQSLEGKLKKAHVMLKSRDEDLRLKAKHACDLQFEVDDLKLKLEVEQRRASIYPSMDIQAPFSLVQQESYLTPANYGGTAGNTQLPIANVKKLVWNCPSCTFQNKKEDIKCQMCLTQNQGTIRYVEVD